MQYSYIHWIGFLMYISCAFFFKFSSKREKCLMDIGNEEDDEDGSSRLSGKNKLTEFAALDG